MLVMVLTDLAAICKKLADNSVLPEELRVQARQFVAEFNFLLPFRGKGTASQLCAGEALFYHRQKLVQVKWLGKKTSDDPLEKLLGSLLVRTYHDHGQRVL